MGKFVPYQSGLVPKFKFSPLKKPIIKDIYKPIGTKNNFIFILSFFSFIFKKTRKRFDVALFYFIIF